MPNIVFVLSIDKTQLGNAVCGVYGSEKLDSNEYLKRFIDIEYSIPEAEKGKYFEYLYDYFDYDTFFKSAERNRYSGFEYDKDKFVLTGKMFLGNLTLRQQEKILAHTRITFRTLNYDNYLIPTIFIFLVYIKMIHERFYSALSNKKLSIIEIQEEFFQIVHPFIDDDNKSLCVEIEAYLLKFYENFKSEHKSRGHSEIIGWDSTENKDVLKIDSKIDNNLFLKRLTNGKLSQDYSDMKLSYFLSKLNLTDNIKIN